MSFEQRDRLIVLWVGRGGSVGSAKLTLRHYRGSGWELRNSKSLTGRGMTAGNAAGCADLQWFARSRAIWSYVDLHWAISRNGIPRTFRGSVQRHFVPMIRAGTSDLLDSHLSNERRVKVLGIRNLPPAYQCSRAAPVLAQCRFWPRFLNSEGRAQTKRAASLGRARQPRNAADAESSGRR